MVDLESEMILLDYSCFCRCTGIFMIVSCFPTGSFIDIIGADYYTEIWY